jgi:hypothetical protein
MEKNINLSLNVDQLNLIFGALSEIPFKLSAKIIDELNRQIAPQLQQAPQQAPENFNFSPETTITKN